MDYILIDNDEKLAEQVSYWNTLSRIAVDFEGEFNLHIYGEHLCLIQVYDGAVYYIIDPRSPRLSKEALCSFFTSPVKKVWFDMQSDNSLIFKNYGVSLANVTDIRIMAKCLDFQGNLKGLAEEYLGIREEYEDKKKLQQTNWLKRPLDRKQVEYALSDVEYLFALEDVLSPIIREKKLEKQCEHAMKEARTPASPKPAWTRICNWRMLNAAQKSAVKEYFLARDAVARRFNVPAYYVLDKHRIADAGRLCPESEKELFAILGPLPPRFASFLTESMKKAFARLHSGENS